ncbi:hypothetical protein BCV72DRAFT_44663 [Rhizopus microsporus var. microsporus]|uniref:Uncharacterized protein n=2 Tax=Rhizopus microsporus TaxID=58291 RepID=A0A2G4SKL2_RHIZD|nr:uncharacterized protein RHIMIDRAFT_50588 [Rhizopus microsporus ATCC 52813]ORE02728.1 hypothetical protein BCV72DRAFT_44663 [Rhizopus microsporus var. microsporus]PHZ09318.1 hypothetical protein RHIMIDRAFT_50588 [Rhizopus microsporus ATCC 52813]
MIIASPAKKEISIPLQPLSTSSSSSSSSSLSSSSSVASNSTVSSFQDKEEVITNATTAAAATVDHVTVHPRTRGQNDMITQVFGQASLFDTQVNDILSITTSLSGSTVNKSIKTLTCEAFIHNETVFLSSPFVGTNAGILNWADGEFQSCITHLIELAEEKTGCTALIVAIDRRLYKESLSTVLRAFMYLGFEMVSPSVHGQEPGYILVGYEL